MLSFNKSLVFVIITAVGMAFSAFALLNRHAYPPDRADSTMHCTPIYDPQIITQERKEDNINDFHYSIGTRFSGIKKQDLIAANSIADILPQAQTEQIVSYGSLQVYVLDHDRIGDVMEAGTNATLTEPQKQLLRTVDYSTNFMLRAEYQKQSMLTGMIEETYATPHFTVVPEYEARYHEGTAALIRYLTKHSQTLIEETDVESLEPGKIYFTISKDAKVVEVNLATSCGYSSIDQHMIKLLEYAPGQWLPAKNKAGEVVDQQLTFFFGIIGC